LKVEERLHLSRVEALAQTTNGSLQVEAF
jgi:hypothetical protein